MNTGHLSSMLASFGLGLGMLLAAPASWSADNFTAVTAAETATKAKKPKQAKAPKPPASPVNGESKVERDKRLLRECKGKPNAGACEGYGS
ncbi:hypothetical protein [Limnohabitans sp. Rim8]|jgi:hypothetical protein|uniref:hypothetical protein n=1 Tax=Limnohabitans sp. Rim8 TaxID=1100718 RepID=UPI0025F2FA4B|nr:hypothetical protein [Limnohabitans sp. Rim8]